MTFDDQALLMTEDDFDPREREQWRDYALCAQTDPDMFFPEKGSSAKDAIEVCWDCPVRKQCLDMALANDEPFGILGGLSRTERLAIQLHHKRKTDVTDEQEGVPARIAGLIEILELADAEASETSTANPSPDEKRPAPGTRTHRFVEAYRNADYRPSSGPARWPLEKYLREVLTPAGTVSAAADAKTQTENAPAVDAA